MPLPADIPFGYVVGRFMLAVGDTPADEDALPDAAPVLGTVRFRPEVPIIVSLENQPTTIVTQTVEASLVNGVLTDSSGNEGVWLVAGVYNVTFQMQPGIALPPIRAVVSEEIPLDLTLAAALTL